MPELRHVNHAERSPTKCLLCHTHEGPFIDCQQEIPIHGWVYICVGNEDRPGCLIQMARMVGMAETSVAFQTRQALDEALANIDRLDAELAEKTTQVVVNVEDLRQLLERPEPETPEPAGRLRRRG